MKVVKHEKDKVEIEVTREELIILNNTLNEVLNALDIDFEVRVGTSISQAEKLLDKISLALKVFDLNQ